MAHVKILWLNGKDGLKTWCPPGIVETTDAATFKATTSGAQVCVFRIAGGAYGGAVTERDRNEYLSKYERSVINGYSDRFDFSATPLVFCHVDHAALFTLGSDTVSQVVSVDGFTHVNYSADGYMQKHWLRNVLYAAELRLESQANRSDVPLKFMELRHALMRQPVGHAARAVTTAADIKTVSTAIDSVMFHYLGDGPRLTIQALPGFSTPDIKNKADFTGIAIGVLHGEFNSLAQLADNIDQLRRQCVNAKIHITLLWSSRNSGFDVRYLYTMATLDPSVRLLTGPQESLTAMASASTVTKEINNALGEYNRNPLYFTLQDRADPITTMAKELATASSAISSDQLADNLSHD